MLIDRLGSLGYLYSSLLPRPSLSLSTQIYWLQLLIRGSQCRAGPQSAGSDKSRHYFWPRLNGMKIFNPSNIEMESSPLFDTAVSLIWQAIFMNNTSAIIEQPWPGLNILEWPFVPYGVLYTVQTLIVSVSYIYSTIISMENCEIIFIISYNWLIWRDLDSRLLLINLIWFTFVFNVN